MRQNHKYENAVYYYNANDSRAAREFGLMLSKLLIERSYMTRPLIFLCIGSDRATGDCLGPILGYKLLQNRQMPYIVYGTLKSPIHAKNLNSAIIQINSEYSNPLIIAIDASLGKSSHIGFITLGVGALCPGAGVNKVLPSVGDLFITGIVNLSGIFDNMLLQTTRLQIVMSLADQICSGIEHCMRNLRIHEKKSAAPNTVTCLRRLTSS